MFPSPNTSSSPSNTAPPRQKPRRILITAGPTHEPIDAVRFIGNRSSGRMGTSLADAAAARNWTVSLLLGPATVLPQHSCVTTHRFRTAADLQALLAEHVPNADVLVMAAAVADFRPKVDLKNFNGKFRRSDQSLHLELEPTPDLLAQVAATKRANQLMVGFALEPRAELIASAIAKLERKRVDLVVGNPLETMDSPTIEATVFSRDGSQLHTAGAIEKPVFALWLLDIIEHAYTTLLPAPT